jgi:protein TonB
MYADRHHMQTTRFSPTGLTAAIAVNALFVAALIFSVPTIVPTLMPDKPLKTFVVPADPPPPPPERIEPRPRTNPVDELILAPIPQVPIPISRGVEVDTAPVAPAGGSTIGTDPLPVAVDMGEPAPPPALVEPSLDQRYARDFQPVYPAAERRAGREGRVTVSVLVGVDGRVKEARRVGATSDAFWQVTLDRALAKWRFKPGTRGGVPVEAWRRLTLTFVLED